MKVMQVIHVGKIITCIWMGTSKSIDRVKSAKVYPTKDMTHTEKCRYKLSYICEVVNVHKAMCQWHF